MLNPKAQFAQKSAPSNPPKPILQGVVSTFSDDEIRARAYEIYESGDRNGNRAERDWFQAETELMELVGGK